jgi:FtsH-binding integral membrane protein
VTTRSQRRRISPGIVFLVVALVASVAFTAYAITVREASQIPLLAAGAVVLAITFGALAVYCVRAVWRAGRGDQAGRTLLVGVIGGLAAIAAAGAMAGAVILFQLAGTAP